MDDIMFFFYNGPYSGMNFATNSIYLYRKVGQNSISYY